MYDAIIIGAGIIGTSIARELSRYQLNVLILEKSYDVSMGATKANSAIVHGGYAESNASLKGRLCYKGRVQFDRLNRELNFGFDPRGSLVTTMEDDPKPLQTLMENGIKNGLDDLSIIGAEAIRKIEPALNKEIKWALHCKGAGVCSPYEMAIAMAENAIENGVTLQLENRVQGIKKVGDSFEVTTDKGYYRGKYVINAAGVFSDEISEMIGVKTFKIIPTSGQYILFTRGTGKPINTVIFQLPTKMGKGILLTSTYYDNLLIGPDANHDEVRDNTSTDIDRIAHIYSQAKNLYNQINPKQFIRSFSGIRAKSSTDDFIIEETRVRGFINVGGIQSPGLTASPAIANRVVEILEKSGLSLVENVNFNPYRRPIIKKHELKPFKEIKDLIDMPSADEKVICRCEQVTQGEIIDSLHRGIELKTVDSVKRRTRATMGWCQGDFCKDRIIKIMEREYNKEIDPLLDIDHSGASRVGKSDLLDFLKSQESKES